MRAIKNYSAEKKEKSSVSKKARPERRKGGGKGFAEMSRPVYREECRRKARAEIRGSVVHYPVRFIIRKPCREKRRKG